MENDKKIKLAVFDFDGTYIPDQSGMRLSIHLLRTKKMTKKNALKLMFWGVKYKTHLPYKEAYPREMIFCSFANENAKEVDKYIDNFYDEQIEPTVRTELDKVVKEHKKEGVEPVLLSAAFWTVLQRFAKKHGFSNVVGTSMEIDKDGLYTGKTKGQPVAGEQKVIRLKKFADEKFGKGNWTLEYAYADHYTDKDLLQMAKHPCAVNPDDTLEKYAKKQNWDVIHIDDQKEKIKENKKIIKEKYKEITKNNQKIKKKQKKSNKKKAQT